MAMNGDVPPIQAGDVVILDEGVGVVRFAGETHFAPGTWYGVELKSRNGNCDGSYQGHRYFSCGPEYGCFVNSKLLRKIPAEDLLQKVAELNYVLSRGGGGSDTRLFCGDCRAIANSGARVDQIVYENFQNWIELSTQLDYDSLMDRVPRSHQSYMAILAFELIQVSDEMLFEKVKIMKLVNSGAFLNYADEDGYSLLMLCCGALDVDVFHFSPHLRAKSEVRKTPKSITEARLEIALLMLEKTRNGKRIVEITRKSKTGENALGYLLRTGEKQLARLLEIHGSRLPNTSTWNEDLKMAVRRRDFKRIDLLFSFGLRDYRTAPDGKTSLMEAITSNDEDIARRLIGNQDDINMMSQYQRFEIKISTRPLGLQFIHTDDGLRLMVNSITQGGYGEKCGIQVGDVLTHLNGKTANDAKGLLEMYQKAELPITAQFERQSKNALMVAVLHNNERMVRLLLEVGADPSLKHRRGNVYDFAHEVQKTHITKLLQEIGIVSEFKDTDVREYIESQISRGYYVSFQDVRTNFPIGYKRTRKMYEDYRESLFESKDGYVRSYLMDNLPAYDSVPEEQRQTMLLRKMTLCGLMFDPRFQFSEQMREHFRIRKLTILREILQHVTTLDNLSTYFTRPVLEEFFKMVRINLFDDSVGADQPKLLSSDNPERPNTINGFVGLRNPRGQTDKPTAQRSNKQKELANRMDQQNYLQRQVLYECLLRVVLSPHLETQTLLGHVNESFLVAFADFFYAPQPPERSFVKDILHHVYERFATKRKFLLKVLADLLRSVVAELDGTMPGVAEMLEFYALILKGEPLGKDHMRNLEDIMLPLHKDPSLADFQDAMLALLRIYVTKDASLVPNIMQALLQMWPEMLPNKQMLYYDTCVYVMEMVPLRMLDSVVEPFFSQVAGSITRGQLTVSNYVLGLWQRESFVTLLNEYRTRVFKLVGEALLQISQKDYEDVSERAEKIIYLLKQMDADLWAQVTARYEFQPKMPQLNIPKPSHRAAGSRRQSMSILRSDLDIETAILRATSQSARTGPKDSNLVPKHPQAKMHHAEARRFEKERNLEAAEQEYLKALEIEPNAIIYRAGYVHILNEMGKYEEVVTQSERIFQLDPTCNMEGVHNNYGLALESLQRFEEAEQHYLLELEHHSGNTVCHSNLGSLYHGLARYDEAEEHFLKALEMDPHCANSHNAYAELLCSLGRFEEAETHCAEAIRLEKDNSVYHVNYGLLLEDLKRWDEAEKHYEVALQLEPHNGDYHNVYAVLLHSLKRYDECERHFQDAIRIHPDYPEYHYNYGRVLADMKKFDQAEQCYTQALALDSTLADCHNHFARLLWILNRYEESEQHYKVALNLNPDNSEYHHNYGRLLGAMDRKEEAELHWKEAIRLEPDKAKYHYNYADMLEGIRRYEMACQEYQTAVDLDPDKGVYHVSFALLLQKLGRYGEARSHFEHAIRLDPNDEWYKKCYDDFMRKLNQSNKR